MLSIEEQFREQIRMKNNIKEISLEDIEAMERAEADKIFQESQQRNKARLDKAQEAVEMANNEMKIIELAEAAANAFERE